MTRPALDLDGKQLPREEWCDKLGHCWHAGDEQHCIDQHRDDVCCYCGERRCVSVPRPRRSGRGSHGAHGAHSESSVMIGDGQ